MSGAHLTLAPDQGTTSSRAALADREDRIIASAQRETTIAWDRVSREVADLVAAIAEGSHTKPLAARAGVATLWRVARRFEPRPRTDVVRRRADWRRAAECVGAFGSPPAAAGPAGVPDPGSR